MAEMLDWNELSEAGLIVRINDEILHPIGLAMCRTVEDGKSPGALVSDDGVWEYAKKESNVAWVETLDVVFKVLEGEVDVTEEMIDHLYEIRSFLIHNQKEEE